jgi:shikimate dehydrogenase
MPSEVWLLGNLVMHSLSPAMQNAAFRRLTLDCHYRPRELDTAELAGAILEMRQYEEVLGANVTIPHKQAVIPLLDTVDSLAWRVGAVNTISRRDGRLVGSNTDVVGFNRALDDCGYVVECTSVLLIGAGGAARAVGEALRTRAGKLTVMARDPRQARRLIDELSLETGEAAGIQQLTVCLQSADLIVNATPADLPPPPWTPSPGQRLFDLRSRRSPEGRAMLLHQGAASFEIWTGRPAPLEAMRAALNAAAATVAV